MLRKIRTILAAVFFVLITLLFLDFTGTLHHWLSWMAKIQFLPAVMALNVVVVVALVLLTLVFGRIYCSERRTSTAILKKYDGCDTPCWLCSS